MFVQRFHYNSGADDNTGGSEPIVEATTTDVIEPEAKVAGTSTEVIAEKVDKIDIPLSQMKEWGFDSQTQMAEYFAKQKELNKPDEEKQKAIELENANFRAFAIKEGDLKEEDFNTHAAYTKAVDKELVFEKSFLPEFKAENPDITDEEELLQAAKDEFDAEYKTASAKRLAKEAAELRSEISNKYNNAQENYKADKKYKDSLKPWGEFIKDTFTKAVGDKFVLASGKDGEDEYSIDFDLTDAEKAEIVKSVVSTKRFTEFVNGENIEGLQKKLTDRAVGYLTQKYAKVATEKALQKGIEIGKKRGSNVGANNPFPLVNQGGTHQAAATQTLAESQASISHVYRK